MMRRCSSSHTYSICSDMNVCKIICVCFQILALAHAMFIIMEKERKELEKHETFYIDSEENHELLLCIFLLL